MRTKTSKKKHDAYQALQLTMDSIATIASDIWNELVEASRIESPLNMKPFYDDMVKK
jgi:hypothetical protein